MHERVSEDVVLLESQPGRCLLQLPPMNGLPGSASLATVFTEVGNSMQALAITEYSLWRPSLEQVFLRFAREQEERDLAASEQPGVEEAPAAAAAAAAVEAAAGTVATPAAEP